MNIPTPQNLSRHRSSGLIGSEICACFPRALGHTIHGVDNYQRAVFFGPKGGIRFSLALLAANTAWCFFLWMSAPVVAETGPLLPAPFAGWALLVAASTAAIGLLLFRISATPGAGDSSTTTPI